MQDFMTFLSNHPALSFASVLLIALLAIVELLRSKRNRFQISSAHVTKLINQENAVIIDLRSKDLFNKGHIIGAQSFVAKEIQDMPKRLERFKTRPIIVVCSTGIESQKIAAFLLKQDYNAYALTGGLRAWSEAGMPLVKE